MIERTYDTSLVRSILSNETLRERGGKYVPLESYDPENQKELIYLLAKEDEVLGVILYHVFNHPICYQIHVNYLPQFWGSGLIKYTNEAIDWIFTNTNCLKVIALIPDSYPEVLKHAEKAGLQLEGYLRHSTMVNNQLDNQVLMSIDK